MNWEAFFVIGAFALILGIILLVPGLMFARKEAKKDPDQITAMVITKAGYSIYGTMALVLLVGSTSQHWAADTAFGQWISTRAGRYVFCLVVVAATVLIERLLNASGIKLVLLVKRD